LSISFKTMGRSTERFGPMPFACAAVMNCGGEGGGGNKEEEHWGEMRGEGER
jgi:hypothetical protein